MSFSALKAAKAAKKQGRSYAQPVPASAPPTVQSSPPLPENDATPSEAASPHLPDGPEPSQVQEGPGSSKLGGKHVNKESLEAEDSENLVEDREPLKGSPFIEEIEQTSTPEDTSVPKQQPESVPTLSTPAVIHASPAKEMDAISSKPLTKPLESKAEPVVPGAELFTRTTINKSSGLRIRSSPQKGRELWSTKLFKPGDDILSVSPLVFALSSQNLDIFCSACGHDSRSRDVDGSVIQEVKRCTRCRTVAYCNAKCQNKDWTIHKHECAALQRCMEKKSALSIKGKEKARENNGQEPSGGPGLPGEAIRCLGRILWTRRYNSGLNEVKKFDFMQSQRTTLKSSSYESHTHLAHALVRYIGATSPTDLAVYGLEAAKDLVDIISRFTTNTFALTNPDLEPIGVAVSPDVALINHSCEPNAVLVFPRASAADGGPSMRVVALRTIKPDEEIMISYIDTTVSRKKRQEELELTYGFLCKCESCVAKPGSLDPRECVRCPRIGCNGFTLFPVEEGPPPACATCKERLTSDECGSILDAIRVGEEGLEKATHLQFSDPENSYRLVSNLIPLLTSTGLPPSSHPLLGLTRLHQALLVSVLSSQEPTKEILDDAARAAAKSAAGLSTVLVEGHPVRGIALAELGKILIVDEPGAQGDKSSTSERTPRLTNAPTREIFPPSGAARLRLACETLIKAKGELTIGFGNDSGGGGGQMGRMVREMIRRVERELGVWDGR